MLHRETVEAGTLALLTELSKDTGLKDFFLVGGTALALQLGHRLSIDLDFFTRKGFEPEELLDYLHKQYPNRNITKQAEMPNTLLLGIDGIKVDFITHNYRLVNPLETYGPIRMASLDDIAAMKVNAVINSGERVKDFVDLAEISKHRNLDQVLEAFKIKYPQGNPAFGRLAIGYFADVNLSEKPVMLQDKFNWEKTQAVLRDFMQPNSPSRSHGPSR